MCGGAGARGLRGRIQRRAERARQSDALRGRHRQGRRVGFERQAPRTWLVRPAMTQRRGPRRGKYGKRPLSAPTNVRSTSLRVRLDTLRGRHRCPTDPRAGDRRGVAANPIGAVVKASISGAPFCPGSTNPLWRDCVDRVDVRFLGCGCVVASDTARVGESGAIADVVDPITVGLTAVDVESPQRIRGDLFGCVVGPELADEVVGAESCQPIWGAGLR